MNHIKISPSILSADYDNINQDIAQIELYSDMIHIDMMDGIFVPNVSFDIDFIRNLRTKLPLDIHLMVKEPTYEYIDQFDGLNVEYITIHYEAVSDISDILLYIIKKGIKVGLAIKPNTRVDDIIPYLDQIDMLLVMTVEPGKGGQRLIDTCLDKVKYVRRLKPELDIEVDGGVNKDTINRAYTAGANIFVAGSAIFKEDIKSEALFELMGTIWQVVSI